MAIFCDKQCVSGKKNKNKTTRTRKIEKLPIVVKLVYCFDAMGRNVNKQSRIWGPQIFNKFILFCNIFTCMDNFIWQFLILTGIGLLLKYG